MNQAAGSNEHPGKGELSLPTKLYGRSAELASLISVFEDACLGNGGLLLVPGRSGVGKTSLIRQMAQPVLDRNGLFCQGKFNQYQTNIPYSAIQQAMGEVWQAFCPDSICMRDNMRAIILRAVGNFGQLLIDLNPEAELVLGKQPAVETIPPHEARHRFISIFRKVLNAFSRPESPLVLFLDDWQWADQASLNLLKQLFIEGTPRYFLLIAAYRDDEVEETHPFAQAIQDMRQRGARITTLPVSPIDATQTQRLLTDTLTPTVENLAGLNTIIYDRTHGNPFFVHAFLRYIYDIGILTYQSEARSWTWNNEDSSLFPLSVESLFRERFRRRPPEVQNILAHAACLGNRFNTTILAAVISRRVGECLELLGDELDKGFIIPSTPTDWTEAEWEAVPVELRFAHDRVQQAAYGLIGEEELTRVKLTIARKMLQTRHHPHSGEMVFEITNNFNSAISLLTDHSERVEVIEMNREAAQRATTATAYGAALQFQQAAGELLLDAETNTLMWKSHHNEAIALHLEWASNEFLEGDQNRAEALVKTAVEHSRTPLEMAEAQRVLIVQYTLQARYAEAIDAARTGLNALGIILPEDNYATFRDIEIQKIRQNISETQLTPHADIAVMSNQEKMKATQLLITMGPPCYRSHQSLWSVLVPTAVNLMLEYGAMPEIGYSHTALAGLLIWVNDDFTTAQEFTNLATTLMRHTFESPSDQSVFYLMLGSSARHWFHHMSRCSNDYDDAYDIGSRYGNLQYAAYAFGHNMYCGFFQGMELKKLLIESVQSLSFSRTRHNQWAIDLLEGGIHVIKTLTGEEPFTENAESHFLQLLSEHGNIQVECIYAVLRSFHFLIINERERALAWSDRAQRIIYTVGTQGLLPWPEHMLIRGILLASFTAEGDTRSNEWRNELELIRIRLRRWNRHCPDNYRFKHFLFEAEMAVVENAPARAAGYYETALEAAQAGGFLQWEAVTNERAARFWEQHKQGQTAQVYWQQAYSCYENWGATLKLSIMERHITSSLNDCFSGFHANADSPDTQSVIQAICTKQLALLHSSEMQEEEMSRRHDAERQAKDLARAMARLREEVATRKHAERELREQEQRLRLTFDKSPIGVALVAMDRTFIKTNETIGKILGYNLNSLNTLTITDISHPRDKDSIDHLLTRMLSNDNNNPSTEKRFITMVGETVWCKLTLSIIHDEENQPLYFLLTLEDITDRKKVELDLITAKEAALHADRSKSRFLANMSHEIRTPINGILGMLQLMQRTELNHEQSQYADTAIQSCARLTRLLSDILDLSKVEAGRLKVAEEPFDFFEVTDSLASLFAPAAVQRNINLIVDIAPTIPRWLLGDAIRLQQILSNLLGNALKFTDEGTITMEAWSIINTHSEHCRVIFRIADTGIGISEEQQIRLFEPFVQGETEYARNYQGAGLGLAISRELINLMHGEMAVSSEEGVGTEFYLSIPYRIAPSKHSSEKPAHTQGKNRKVFVLLAEDDTVSSLFIRKLLEKGGHTVKPVRNGHAAVIALSEEDFDLILMDIQMPIMDGLEATRAIRRGDSGETKKNIPIVALTAYAMTGDREKFLSCGMSDYLSKPVDIDSLDKLLQKFATKIES